PPAAPTLGDRVRAAETRTAPSSTTSANTNLSDLPEAERLHKVKAAVHDRIIGELGERANELDREAISQRATEVLDAYLESRRVNLTKMAREQLLGALLADILGYGPLDVLLADEAISDIMVNGPQKVYIERGNKMQRVAIRFDSDSHLMQVIQRIVTGVGRRVDESSPMVDARLPDGSRVNVIIPPLAVRGASIINTRRMRPERVVVGEVRSGEALDMLQAMNTGHDGSLTTLHANTPRDWISRLETLVLMAGMELPSRAIREQIASAINIIIQQNRLRDGTRKITYISEVTGIEGDQISLQDIFVYKQTGYETGKVTGLLTATGATPRMMEVLEATGNAVPMSFFDPHPDSGFVRPKRLRVVPNAA